MSPFYPPLPQAMPANPMGSALAGYGAVQDIQTGQSRNALMQMQLEKAQRGESALAEFGKSGDLEAVKKIDPATWMALDDRQRKVLGDAAELHGKMKSSAYGNLEFYNKEYRPTMLKLGISPAMMPEYKTVEELNQGLYRNERIAAEIKSMSGRPVTLHPGGAAFSPVTGKKLYEQPALPEKPLDAARRENLEADLKDPTRKQRPEKPETNLEKIFTDKYVTQYMEDNPEATETEARLTARKEWLQQKPPTGKGKTPGQAFREGKTPPGTTTQPGTHRLFNNRTGQYENVTKQQYDAFKAAQGTQ